MAFQIELRRGTAANWTSTNPTLSQGEFGLETDTLKIKLGDGVTAWNSLSYYLGTAIQGLSAGSGITIVGGSGVHVSVTRPREILFASGIKIGGSGAGTVSVYYTSSPNDRRFDIPDASGTATFVISSGTISYTSGALFGTNTSGLYAPRLISLNDIPAIPSTGLAQTASTFFFEPTMVSDISPYKVANPVPNATGAAVITGSLVGTGYTLLQSFATPSGFPNSVYLPIGVCFEYFHVSTEAANQVAQLRADFYTCSVTGANETFQHSIYSDTFSDTTILSLTDSHAHVTGVYINASDRLIWKIYGARVSGPSNCNLSIYCSGAQYPSFVELPIIPSLNDNLVLAGSGITISNSIVNVAVTQPRSITFASGANIGSTATGVAATLSFTNVSGTQTLLFEPTGNSEIRFPSASGYSVLATGYTTNTSGILFGTSQSGVYQPRQLIDNDLPPRAGHPLAKCSGTVGYGIPGIAVATANQNVALLASTVYYYPFVVQKQITITTVSIYVGIQPGVQCSGRVAIYNADNNWQPTTLVSDIGNYNCQNSAGIVAVSGLSIVLNPGVYLSRFHTDANNTVTLGGFKGGPITGPLISDNALNNYATLLRRSLLYQAAENNGLAWDAYTNSTTLLFYGVFFQWTST